MSKKTVQELNAEYVAIVEKFPDAYRADQHVAGVGAVWSLFSESATPTHLLAETRRRDGMPMLMASAGVEVADGTITAVLHPDARAVPWWPVLRALKILNPEAYAALLDVVVRMSNMRDPDPGGESLADKIIDSELARFRAEDNE